MTIIAETYTNFQKLEDALRRTRAGQSKPEAAESVVRLAPGTQVTLVRAEQGWTLVARDGKALGYVAATDLAPLQ
jgi:hypothetical protein